MTNEQLEQVVELLRCAADRDPNFPDFPLGLTEASEHCATSDAVTITAIAALTATRTRLRRRIGHDPSHEEMLLEAAQRVDERSWP